MVEKIYHVRAEVIGVNNPSVEGDGDAELMLFVAFSVKRNESQIVRIGEFNQRAGRCNQRRRLIVVAVERSEGPVETRKVQRDTEAGTDRAF